MGLFDFAKGIGKKLFGSDDADAGEKIKAHIEKDNPGVDNLSITVEGGVAKISGEAKDSAALEKAILMAGNVEGVEKVESQVTGAEPAANVDYYEIKSGDTLWKIAETAYGNGSKYTEIFEANREVIQDPDKIYPGQKIRIPK